MSDVKMNFFLHILPRAVSPQVVLFLVLSVLSSPPSPWTITSMQMIFNCSFLSIHPTVWSITHLYDALQLISSWMTANLLILNSSEIELLLIGLKKQLTKIHNSSINPTQSARNLGLSSTHILPFQIRSILCPDLAIIIFVNCIVSILTSIPKLPLILPLPSSTQNLITAILFTTASLNLS